MIDPYEVVKRVRLEDDQGQPIFDVDGYSLWLADTFTLRQQRDQLRLELAAERVARATLEMRVRELGKRVRRALGNG